MAKKKASKVSKVINSSNKCESCACPMWISILVLIVGLLWLGNDLSWWTLNLPFLPIIIVILAIDCVMKSK